MDKKELICFIGMRNTGKGYQSKSYIDKGYKKISLAGTLRDLLYRVINYTPSNYDEFKVSDVYIDIKSKFLGFIPYTKKLKITKGRNLLQNIGSGIKDLFDPEIWATTWYKKVLDSGCNVCCDDVRFDYEIKKALSLTKKGYKVKFVWCCYSGANFEEILSDKHESEALAQFIYLNSDKYKVKDGCEIPKKTLLKIIKDFNNEHIKNEEYEMIFNSIFK